MWIGANNDQRLDKWFWSMFEPIPAWPIFFPLLINCLWIGSKQLENLCWNSWIMYSIWSWRVQTLIMIIQSDALWWNHINLYGSCWQDEKFVKYKLLSRWYMQTTHYLIDSPTLMSHFPNLYILCMSPPSHVFKVNERNTSIDLYWAQCWINVWIQVYYIMQTSQCRDIYRR